LIMRRETLEILHRMYPNAIPPTLPRFGSGRGSLMERDKATKDLKNTLRMRQHGRCAVYDCKHKISSKIKFECSHIVPHHSGAPLYLESEVYPEAIYPNAFLQCRIHNQRMSNHTVFWIVEASAYYGWGEIERTIYEDARAMFEKTWEPNGKIFWPFWLVSERERPIFLVDGFDEQEYFRKMIETYKEWDENEDGGIFKTEMARSFNEY